MAEMNGMAERMEKIEVSGFPGFPGFPAMSEAIGLTILPRKDLAQFAREITSIQARI